MWKNKNSKETLWKFAFSGKKLFPAKKVVLRTYWKKTLKKVKTSHWLSILDQIPDHTLCKKARQAVLFSVIIMIIKFDLFNIDNTVNFLWTILCAIFKDILYRFIHLLLFLKTSWFLPKCLKLAVYGRQ